MSTIMDTTARATNQPQALAPPPTSSPSPSSTLTSIHLWALVAIALLLAALSQIRFFHSRCDGIAVVVVSEKSEQDGKRVVVDLGLRQRQHQQEESTLAFSASDDVVDVRQEQPRLSVKPQPPADKTILVLTNHNEKKDNLLLGDNNNFTEAAKNRSFGRIVGHSGDRDDHDVLKKLGVTMWSVPPWIRDEETYPLNYSNLCASLRGLMDHVATLVEEEAGELEGSSENCKTPEQCGIAVGDVEMARKYYPLSMRHVRPHPGASSSTWKLMDAANAERHRRHWWLPHVRETTSAAFQIIIKGQYSQHALVAAAPAPAISPSTIVRRSVGDEETAAASSSAVLKKNVSVPRRGGGRCLSCRQRQRVAQVMKLFYGQRLFDARRNTIQCWLTPLGASEEYQEFQRRRLSTRQQAVHDNCDDAIQLIDNLGWELTRIPVIYAFRHSSNGNRSVPTTEKKTINPNNTVVDDDAGPSAFASRRRPHCGASASQSSVNIDAVVLGMFPLDPAVASDLWRLTEENVLQPLRVQQRHFYMYNTIRRGSDNFHGELGKSLDGQDLWCRMRFLQQQVVKGMFNTWLVLEGSSVFATFHRHAHQIILRAAALATLEWPEYSTSSSSSSSTTTITLPDYTLWIRPDLRFPSPCIHHIHIDEDNAIARGSEGTAPGGGVDEQDEAKESQHKKKCSPAESGLPLRFAVQCGGDEIPSHLNRTELFRPIELFPIRRKEGRSSRETISSTYAKPTPTWLDDRVNLMPHDATSRYLVRSFLSQVVNCFHGYDLGYAEKYWATSHVQMHRPFRTVFFNDSIDRTPAHGLFNYPEWFTCEFCKTEPRAEGRLGGRNSTSCQDIEREMMNVQRGQDATSNKTSSMKMMGGGGAKTPGTKKRSTVVSENRKYQKVQHY